MSGWGTTEETATEQPWYAYRDTIRKVVLEEGVSTVGSRAFAGCTALTGISFPSTLFTSYNFCIGFGAFQGCTSLASFVFPDGSSCVPNNLFDGCGKLTEITLPGGVTEIGAYTFFNCSGLETVTIPAGVARVGEHAFNGCGSLAVTATKAGKTGASKLIAAAYGADGRMLWIDGCSVDLSSGEAADAVFSFPDALGEAAVTKVFLLDADTDAPLCPACPVLKPKGGA